MQKPSSFLILTLVTVAVVLAALYMQREPGETMMKEGLLFPDLGQKLSRVTQVRITKGKSVIRLHRRGEGQWGMQGRAGYPADLTKIRELLLGVAGLERLEQKTRNPERYGQLGLIEAEGAKSVMRITIQDEEGQSFADFFLGKRNAAKGRLAHEEMYIRIPDDPVVWLVEGNLPHGSETTDWLQGDILTLDEARIRAVHIIHPDGEKVIVRRTDPKATDYRLIGLPKSAEPNPYVVNGIASDMAKLRLQDVRSIHEVDLSTGKPGAKILLTTFDGMRVTMETWRVGKDTLAHLDAGFDTALVQSEPQDDKRQQAIGMDGVTGVGKDIEENKTKEDSKIAAETLPSDEPRQQNDAKSVAREANTLSTKWHDWVYILPKYRLDNLSRRMSDLIKESSDKSDAP